MLQPGNLDGGPSGPRYAFIMRSNVRLNRSVAISFRVSRACSRVSYL